MSYNIEMRHLRYFYVLAEELHFGKAAARLFISQPALSKQIKLLESVIGVALLYRSNKSVSLTRAGKYLKDKSGSLITQLDGAIAQIHSIDRGLEGMLKIGFLGSAMQNVLPMQLKTMNDLYPGITISLDEMSNNKQIEGLKTRQIDIAYIRKSVVPKEIEIVPVFSETFSLVLPENHWIADDNFTDVSQLKNEKFILFERSYSEEYYDAVISIFADQGFIPGITHRSVHATTIFRLVENEIGVSIIPTSLSAGYNLHVRFIELKEIRQRTTLYLAWNSENDNPALHNYLHIHNVYKKSDTQA